MLKHACVHDPAGNGYYHFTLAEHAALWSLLRQARRIVTWNGNRVALLVLRRTFGAEHFPVRGQHVGLMWGEHVDLCAKIDVERYPSPPLSLAKVALLSLGEQVVIRGPSVRGRASARRHSCEIRAALVGRLWLAYHQGGGLAATPRPILFHPENHVYREPQPMSKRASALTRDVNRTVGFKNSLSG
jgi:hypothetical protein